jgi:hypothetical protein
MKIAQSVVDGPTYTTARLNPVYPMDLLHQLRPRRCPPLGLHFFIMHTQRSLGFDLFSSSFSPPFLLRCL